MSCEEFINRVKHFEAIYNKNNFNYKNTNERDKIWKKLSLELNCKARKKWMALHLRYVQEKRREVKAIKSGLVYQSCWKYFDQMSFMHQHIKPQVAKKCESSNTDSQVDVKSLYNEFCFKMDSENSLSDEENPSTVSSESTVCEQPNTNENLDDLITVLQKLQRRIQSFRATENDQDAVFLQLVAIKMKNMTATEKSIFKLDILKTVQDEIINNNSYTS